jgi:hypothetical protein
VVAGIEGFVLEQTGDQIEVGFFQLKEGDGFNVEKDFPGKILRGQAKDCFTAWAD